MIGDDDLELIFANGDFDKTAEFTLTGGSTVCVKGWFTDATEQVSILTGEVEAVKPSFACVASAIATVKRGNTVSICDTVYTIERIERTGVGSAVVHLKT